MKPLFEKILPSERSSFAAAVMTGDVIGCEYHVHPEYEIILVKRGFGSKVINESITRFDSGAVNLIGSMVPHHYFNSPGGEMSGNGVELIVIQFRSDFAGKDFFDLPEFAAVRRMLNEADFGLDFSGGNADIFAAAEQLLSCQGAARFAALLAMLDRMSSSRYRSISHCRLPEQHSDSDGRINRALKFIHNKLAQTKNPSLVDTASHIGMTPENFSRYFVRVTGRNYIDYIISLKLEKAANMLLHSDMQISEICFNSGFSNLSNFNRHFLRLHDMTPGAFRRKLTRNIKQL